MNRRRRIRNDMIRRRTVKCGILIGLLSGMLGIGYAAHTNILTGDFNISTSSMNFIFDSDKNAVVEMMNGSDGDIKDLGGKASYKDKKLSITDIGPIDIEDFIDGNANIIIQYAIKTEDKEIGIKRPAEVKQDDDSGYDLGIVEFELLSNTPVWSLENGDRSWGTKSEGINGTPGIIYQFLPDNLGKFHVYNQLLPHYEDGVTIGMLLLKQVSSPALPDNREIGLSSLCLPSEISNEIQSGSPESILEIQGTYGFAIPINLDQFNVGS